MKNILGNYVLMFFLFGISVGGSCKKTNAVAQHPLDTLKIDRPALSGRLIFHSYSCYSCNDSKMYLYDFGANTLKQINRSWTNVQNGMNAHFSPDGKRIVFMGIATDSRCWSIFSWDLNAADLPKNLTAYLGTTSRAEDPKFSSGGTSIIFKLNGQLTEMDTSGKILRKFTVPQSEASMPYYENGDTAILYAGTVGSFSNIYLYHFADSSLVSKCAIAGVYAYYPITRDDSSFIFTRWNDANNPHDQLYLGFFDNRQSKKLPFNESTADYSDGFPYGNLIFLSSDRVGSIGNYDLYIADMTTGKIWSLSQYNAAINSANNELGACYSDK